VPVTRFYDRPSLHVEVYDTLFGQGVPGGDDVAFFRRLALESGGPVLELGAGTGRVAIPLAEAGVDMTGLDRSAAMLAIAHRKRRALPPEVRRHLRFVQGDMTDLHVGRRFGLVFAAFRVFMALPDVADQRRALDGIRRHLRPGGLLVLDVFDPRLDRVVHGPLDESERREVVHPASGNPVTVTIGPRVNDAIRQVFTQRWRFTEHDPGGAVVRDEEEELTLRWTYRYELRHLLELEGFEPLSELSDYDGSPPAYGQEQIWLARKGTRR